jgi:hypothetical protein
MVGTVHAHFRAVALLVPETAAMVATEATVVMGERAKMEMGDPPLGFYATAAHLRSMIRLYEQDCPGQPVTGLVKWDLSASLWTRSAVDNFSPFSIALPTFNVHALTGNGDTL